MAFIDGEEKPLELLSTEALLNRLTHSVSSKEGSIIRKILENREVFPQIRTPLSLQQNITTQKWPYFFANPLLDPTRFTLCVDPAKDDTDLKINVKRHKIKFNFNN